MGSHQPPGPQAGLLLPVKLYTAGTQASLPGSPRISGKRGID